MPLDLHYKIVRFDVEKSGRSFIAIVYSFMKLVEVLFNVLISFVFVTLYCWEHERRAPITVYLIWLYLWFCCANLIGMKWILENLWLDFCTYNNFEIDWCFFWAMNELDSFVAGQCWSPSSLNVNRIDWIYVESSIRGSCIFVWVYGKIICKDVCSKYDMEQC